MTTAAIGIRRVRELAPLFKLRICSLIALSAIVGLVSAQTGFELGKALILAIATMMASASASAFNHFFDVDIDNLMQRTKARPIPTGLATSRWVLWASALTLAASIVLSSLALNFMVALHLFLGAFFYAVVYTVWLKRKSWVNIIVGGLAGSFAVLAGGASASPELCVQPVLLSLVLFFWTPSHFWAFAILNKEEYDRAKVPMLPNVIGVERTTRWILVNTILLVGASLAPSIMSLLGPAYTVCALFAGAYFLFLNLRLIKDPSKKNARANFIASMVYLSVLFVGVIVDYLI